MHTMIYHLVLLWDKNQKEKVACISLSRPTRIPLLSYKNKWVIFSSPPPCFTLINNKGVHGKGKGGNGRVYALVSTQETRSREESHQITRRVLYRGYSLFLSSPPPPPHPSPLFFFYQEWKNTHD